MCADTGALAVLFLVFGKQPGRATKLQQPFIKLKY
jgi:hypothetical protein